MRPILSQYFRNSQEISIKKEKIIFQIKVPIKTAHSYLKNALLSNLLLAFAIRKVVQNSNIKEIEEIIINPGNDKNAKEKRASKTSKDANKTIATTLCLNELLLTGKTPTKIVDNEMIIYKTSINNE